MKNLLVVMLLGAAVGVWSPGWTGAAAQSDLDEFMRQVLARRDENWKKLQQFILDERELVEVRGPAGAPIWGQRREYAWFIQDGLFVRSPTRVDGVEVSESERREYEAQFLRQARAREEREKARTATGGAADQGAAGETASDAAAATGSGSELEGLIGDARRPRFVDSAYFLKFKFEEGKYALVGRERVEGTEVLKIEYYPERLFAHEQDDERRRRREGRRDRGEDVEAALERMMNKVSLVTLWIEPASHQIVKYTFDNVNLDFLPAAWLVRMDDLRAEMTMGQPFPDVWLPKDVDFRFAAMLAIGRLDVHYRLDYHDYHEARTSGRIRGGGGGE